MMPEDPGLDEWARRQWEQRYGSGQMSGGDVGEGMRAAFGCVVGLVLAGVMWLLAGLVATWLL
jgi:hypothetical protein